MAHRLVTDSGGTRWNVWSVRPETELGRGALAVAPQFADGWLAFEHAEPPDGTPAEKRRLAPVPADWANAPDEALLALLASAAPVRRRLPLA